MNKLFSNLTCVKLSEVNFKQKILNSIYFNNNNLTLKGITENSDEIGLDFGFFALSGSNTHGALFTEDAIKKGANLIITDTKGLKIIKEKQLKISTIVFSEPRKIIPELASYFFKKIPSTIVGITGTNGKTSVAHYIRQIWENLGYKSASLGTTGINGIINLQTKHTTPDALKLRYYLNRQDAIPEFRQIPGVHDNSGNVSDLSYSESGVHAVSCGSNHTSILMEDGNVKIFGLAESWNREMITLETNRISGFPRIRSIETTNSEIFLKDWYLKLNINAVIADVLILVIGFILTRFFYFKLFDSYSLIKFTGLFLFIQIVHDILFYIFFEKIVPKGSNKVFD